MPSRGVPRDGERCLRVELPHAEERSEGAHEGGDVDGRVCSEDSADHGSSPITRRRSAVSYSGEVTTSTKSRKTRQDVRIFSSAECFLRGGWCKTLRIELFR